MNKKLYKAVALVLLLGASQMYAGNPQRAGQAGASELLINPWARSSGWGGVNVAGVEGVEAVFVNVAGLAHTKKTSIAFSNTQWLLGAGMSVNSFGLNQKVGSNGVLGINATSFDYGEWERTNEDNPEGGIGTISPSAIILGISYAQKFTESIYGGVNIKLWSQSTPNLSASAASFDAGVQYLSGAKKQLKFGITLKNVGPSASYEGDGKSVTLTVPQGGFAQAFDERSATFEQPALIALGGSYDFLFAQQRLTIAGSFQSNSFQKDEYTGGAEYSIKDIVMVRAGYTILDNRGNEQNTSALTGLSAGLSVAVPINDNNGKLYIDYSYRDTSPFDNIHSIGASIDL